MTEDQILTEIAARDALDQLEPAHRLMMILIFRIEQPDDWEAQWPPRFEDIGRYIGIKFDGRPLSEAAIRYRRDQVMAHWAGRRGKLRRSGRRGDLQ